MAAKTTLLAVPNVSEGRDSFVIAAIADRFVAGGATLLDVHSDRDHHRSVYTLAGRSGELAYSLLGGIRAALELVDISDGRGVHPHVGAVDVAPIVYANDRARGAAIAEALLLGDLLGERLELPVFLYGALGGGRTRAELRRGGGRVLAERVANGELTRDFGPQRVSARAGATLLTARPPLVAFNVELAPPAGVVEARAVAARVRDGGVDGLPGVRAIGVALSFSRAALRVRSTGDTGRSSRPQTAVDHPSRLETHGERRPQTAVDPPSRLETHGERRPQTAVDPGGRLETQPPQPGAPDRSTPRAPVGQVSLNVEDPLSVPLRDVLAAVEAAAALVGARVAVAELVGLAPSAALERFPPHVPIVAFHPERHVIERVLERLDPTGAA
ncbi:MAG: hypothetical protein ACYCYN_07630 [Solirubrobacteraceae bacterium]